MCLNLNIISYTRGVICLFLCGGAGGGLKHCQKLKMPYIERLYTVHSDRSLKISPTQSEWYTTNEWRSESDNIRHSQAHTDKARKQLQRELM